MSRGCLGRYRVCGCPNFRATGFPRSEELLSLHYIKKMPDQVMMKFAVSKINKTRQSSGGGLWVSGASKKLLLILLTLKMHSMSSHSSSFMIIIIDEREERREMSYS